MTPRCFLSVSPQISEHWSLPMIRAKLSCSFGIYFCVYHLLCACLRLLHPSIQLKSYTACIVFIFMQDILFPIYCSNFRYNMINNSTQCLAAVATLTSPIVKAQRQPTLKHTHAVLSLVLEFAHLFEVGTEN